ncbi:MAG: HPr(Ser) kinase/phosphatase [Clostridia bacterium]|nr:HPr(Ser) kinase/phosphatase [Clostridia bacterium]
MAEVYSVSLNELVKEFSLEVLYMPEREVMVTCKDVNRPGLPLAGFFDHFEPQRIQIIGKMENRYLKQLGEEECHRRISTLLSKKPIAVVITTGIGITEDSLNCAKEYEVPILRTQQPTSSFMSGLIASLSTRLAPRITRHGVLVEVYGEGMLILGDSGIGKSETAIELVKRGHRLIADDAVEIKRVSEKTLVGSAPEMIRHYVELRGIGIVDIRRIFGMGAVKMTEKIDLVVQIEFWNSEKSYDRFGTETEYIDIMGIKIPQYTIPVNPGRNLAVILEIAAMNHRQKKMGYNTGAELEKKLMESFGLDENGNEVIPRMM